MTNKILTCRSCNGGNLLSVLSLGNTPLANALLSENDLDEVEERFPLDVVFCPRCTLVQITESVPPEKLFREYVYFSSFSDALLRHAKAIAERMIESRGLVPTSLVMEVASNDGYLLRNYVERGISVLGIEPARNVARVARERHGISTIEEFFGQDLAGSLADEGRLADVLHVNNVLAHVPDLNGFVAGIRDVLKTDGIAVIEVPYVKDLIDKVEFDTIYHEHLCYFSATALDHLFRRHALRLADVERVTIHGGSLRLFVWREKRASPQPTVRALLDEEAAWGVADFDFYAGFAAKVESLRESLVALLHELKASGRTIAAYGASAKGSTLLNAFGIGRDVIEFVVDRSTVKQGRFTPGTHMPILAPDMLVQRRPDYLLLLAWNFADEILAQKAAYREAGGRFIIPIPEVRIV